jgi:hypothetical protein
MSKPAPGFTVRDFTGIDPEVVACIADLHPDDMTTADLAAELLKRFELAKIDPPVKLEQSHLFAL